MINLFQFFFLTSYVRFNILVVILNYKQSVNVVKDDEDKIVTGKYV